MLVNQRIFPVLAASTLLFSSLALAESPPADLQELWRIIQKQQQEIKALQQRLDQTDAKVEATGEVMDQVQAGGGGHTGGKNTKIGGYGELHYNSLDNQKAGGSDKDEIDFHRFVLFFSHDFSENIHFFSELELEHSIAGEGKAGEVELEQAFIDFDLNDQHTARAGLFLIPVGIINETHEPPTFYGVERNPIEKNIVPATWWEAGFGMHGELLSGLGYDAYFHSGLNTSADRGYKPRNGRQKVAEAKAEDWAATARLRWTGIPGVEVAATLQYQDNITQSLDATAGSAILYELHTSIQKGPFGLRALYARWDLNGSGPESLGADIQEGFYIEPSYKIGSSLGLFARFNQWDNAAGGNGDSEFEQWDVGVNFWPHPDVVIKADYQDQNSPDGQNEFDGFNLGLGYQF